MASASRHSLLFTACPDCDMHLCVSEVGAGLINRCPRCGKILSKTVANSSEKTLALSLSGLILFFPAMLYTLVTFEVAGIVISGNILDAMFVLFEHGFPFVGLMVLLTSIVLPFLRLFLAFVISLQIKFGYHSNSLPILLRTLHFIDEWGMVDVYLIGILVTLIKMYGLADITYNAGFFCFVGLVVLTASTQAVWDLDQFWRAIGKGGSFLRVQRDSENCDSVTVDHEGLILCHGCNRLLESKTVQRNQQQRCPRCKAVVHRRKENSLQYTWLLVLTAIILFIPANTLPIMRVDFLGIPEMSTIMDGIIYFFHSGDYAIGLVIFIASVLVPLYKIIGLLILLLSVHFRKITKLRQKTRMFRIIEFIGRWSMLDIFVIALLAVLVDFGIFTTINAALAATFFCGVVVLTMLAAHTFDTRLLWDNLSTEKE